MLVTVKTNVREDDLYDVVLLNLTARDVVALRNAHSDLVLNRRFAQAVSGNIISGLRRNPIVSQLHEDWKASGGKLRFEVYNDTEFPVAKPVATQQDLFADWE